LLLTGPVVRKAVVTANVVGENGTGGCDDNCRCHVGNFVLLKWYRSQLLVVAGMVALDVLRKVTLVTETFEASLQQTPERFFT